jgi:hypothetical protein
VPIEPTSALRRQTSSLAPATPPNRAGEICVNRSQLPFTPIRHGHRTCPDALPIIS